MKIIIYLFIFCSFTFSQNTNLYPVKKNNLFGFIDKSGSLKIKYEYENVKKFTEGLSPVKKNHLWGYIDLKGNLIIPNKFDMCLNFSEGFAAVKVGKNWGFIDKKGNFKIEPQYHSVRDFKEGFSFVHNKNSPYKEGFFINKDGAQMFSQTFKKAQSFSNGYAGIHKIKTFLFFTIYDYWTYIDKHGNLVDIKADKVRPFHGQNSYIFRGNRYELINQNMTSLLINEFSSLGNYSEGYAKFKKDNKWGFVNNHGQIVIKEKFEQALNFSDGLVATKLNNKWGYINTSGETVIPHQYDKAFPFTYGLANVIKVKNNTI